MSNFDPREYVGSRFYDGDRLVVVVEAGFFVDKSRTPYLRYCGRTIAGEHQIKHFIETGKEPRS